MVRLMCAPPEENLRPNFSNAGGVEGKPSEEEPLDMVTSLTFRFIADRVTGRVQVFSRSNSTPSTDRPSFH